MLGKLHSIPSAALNAYPEYHRFAEPITSGDYPPLLKELLGDKLPNFTNEEKASLKRGSDFLAINHYTTYMIRHRTGPADSNNPLADVLPGIDMSFNDKDGNEIAPKAGLSWVRPVPWGFGKLLDWAYKR